MATHLPPFPKSFAITMDRRDPRMAALMDLFICVCGHDAEDHGARPTAESRSPCDLAGCGCGRFIVKDVQ